MLTCEAPSLGQLRGRFDIRLRKVIASEQQRLVHRLGKGVDDAVAEVEIRLMPPVAVTSPSVTCGHKRAPKFLSFRFILENGDERRCVDNQRGSPSSSYNQ